MQVRKTGYFIALAFLVCAWSGADARTVRVGFFQAGEHIWQSGLRGALIETLPRLVPDSIQIEFSPDGFRSANWNPDSCRIMANELAHMTQLDLIVTLGPWTAEDLIAAGYKKPIISMYRVDPRLEGLADTAGVPTVDNLTVQVPVKKIERDITMLTQLLPVKRLGYLYFPAGKEAPQIKGVIDSIGKVLGFEAVTAEGVNAFGVFTFFKAYIALDHKIDALYLFPTWGLDGQRLRDLLSQAIGDKIPVFTYEGRMTIERGALASDAGNDLNAVAWYNAWKIVQIIMGKKPSSLPTLVPDEGGLIINEGASYLLKKEFPEEILAQSDILWSLALPQWPHYGVNEAVRRAQDQNPGYLAKYDALTRAGAEASRSWSQYLPSLTASGSAVHVDDNTVINGHEWFKSSQYSAELTLDQPLFSLSAIRAIQLAAKEKASATIDLDQAQLDLEYGVTVAYLNYAKAQLALEDLLNRRRLIDYNLQMAKTKALVGVGSELEINRWATERLTASASVYAARSDLKVGRVLFNALLNQPWDAPFLIDTAQFSDWKFMFAYGKLRPYIAVDSNLTKTEDFLVTKGLAQNPRMRQNTVEVEKQRLRLASNSARFFPSIGLRGTYRTADEYRSDAPLFLPKANTWSLGASFQWPLFLGFDRTNERKAQKARLSELEYGRDEIRLDVMRQVTTLLAELMSTAGRASSLKRSEDLAREQVRLALEQYESGKVGYLECLDASTLSLNSSLSALEARIAFFETAARLVHTLGVSPVAENLSPVSLLFDRLSRQLSPPPPVTPPKLE